MNKEVLYKLLEDVNDKQFFRDLYSNYLRNVHRKNINKPKGKTNYIGIEIECCTKAGKDKIVELLYKHNLQKNIDVTDDQSIRAIRGSPETYEFRILTTEKQLSETMIKLDKFLKEGKFKVNDSCGLHVHLDMRNRNVGQCSSKLLKFQKVLFGMVDKKRWKNQYCSYNFNENTWERYRAVNLTSFTRHRTIEIRLHQGTVKAKEIENWINLLLLAINNEEIPDFKKKSELLPWFDKNQAMKQYFNKKFQSNWIGRHTRMINKYKRIQAQRQLESTDFTRRLAVTP